MNMIVSDTLLRDFSFPGSVPAPAQGVVVVFSDNAQTATNLAPVCEFLGLEMEIVSAGIDLTTVLRTRRPLAVIADVDGSDHDGFHAMKLVARYNPDLPILLLTDGDQALMGAADAVQELWGLTQVTFTSAFPLAGQLVGFLFSAGRRAGCMRLVPV